jgi:DNA-binding transcriptional regulator YiaG
MKGHEVLALRTKLGLSQSALARELGYAESGTVSKWERDVTPIPERAATSLRNLVTISSIKQKGGRK